MKEQAIKDAAEDPEVDEDLMEKMATLEAVDMIRVGCFFVKIKALIIEF